MPCRKHVFQPKRMRPKLRRLKVLPQATEYLHEFSHVTSLHGIRYVGESNRSPVERVCWVVAICVCAALCGLEISKVWTRWRTSPVILSFAPRPTLVRDIPFPVVTICPPYKFRRDKFDYEAVSKRLVEEASGGSTHSGVSQSERLMAEAASLVCEDDHDLFHGLVPNETHVRTLYEIAPRCKDLIQYCGFDYEPVNCDDIFHPILTESGICCSFNLHKDFKYFSESHIKDVLNINTQKASIDAVPNNAELRSERIGQYSGLYVLLKTDERELRRECPNDTFQFFVHGPLEFPRHNFEDIFLVRERSKAVVALRPSKVTTEPALHDYPPHVRNCHFQHDRALRLFQQYTQSNCGLDCMANASRLLCGCQSVNLPSLDNENVPRCSKNVVECQTNKILYDKYVKAYNDFDKKNYSACDCLPPCSEVTYDYHLSFSTMKHLHLYANSTGFRYSELNVFFESRKFDGKQRSEVYGLTDVLSSCGGLLGLFTGFSVITMVEICYFASLRLACTLRRHRNR